MQIGQALLAIDAGPNVFARLHHCGADPLALGDIVLTHRHIDHIGGLPMLHHPAVGKLVS